MLWSKGSIVDLYYQKNRTDFRNEVVMLKRLRSGRASKAAGAILSVENCAAATRCRHPLPSWAATVIPPAACIILLKSFFLPPRYNFP
jgi:hypothetical protein